MKRREVLIASIIGAVAVFYVIGSATSDDADDSGDEPVTLVEAACDMLDDGESPDFTYDVLMDVIGDREFDFPNPDRAARSAIVEAQEQGCGS